MLAARHPNQYSDAAAPRGDCASAANGPGTDSEFALSDGVLICAVLTSLAAHPPFPMRKPAALLPVRRSSRTELIATHHTARVGLRESTDTMTN